MSLLTSVFQYSQNVVAGTKDVKDTLDQDVVMNILTDEGRIKGLFMDGDELYMNATYIKSGTLTLGGSKNQYGARHL